MKHLQKHKHFKKYNKLIFAFRINIQIQDQNNEEQYEEGYSEDEIYDSIGDRLLNLLRKYNIENVLAILAIQQNDPLFNFNQQIYHLVIDLTKDLLNTLYTKLVEQKNTEIPQMSQFENNNNNQQNNLFLTEQVGNQNNENVNNRSNSNANEIENNAKTSNKNNSTNNTNSNNHNLKYGQKSTTNNDNYNYGNIQLYDFPLIQSHQQQRYDQSIQLQRKQRINHVFKNQKPQQVNETSKYQQINHKTKQLINRINHYGIKIEKIIESLDDQDFQQIRFMLQYENNFQLEKILTILLIFYDQSDLSLLNNDESMIQSETEKKSSGEPQKKFTIKQCIQDLNVNQLNYQKTKEIKQILIIDRNLNYNSLFQVQPALANIFLILTYLVFSFELGIDLIEQQNLLFQLKQQSQDIPTNQQAYNDSGSIQVGLTNTQLQSGKNFIIRQRRNIRENNPIRPVHSDGISGMKMSIKQQELPFQYTSQQQQL